MWKQNIFNLRWKFYSAVIYFEICTHLFYFMFLLTNAAAEILSFGKYSVAGLIHLRRKEKDFSK